MPVGGAAPGEGEAGGSLSETGDDGCAAGVPVNPDGPSGLLPVDVPDPSLAVDGEGAVAGVGTETGVGDVFPVVPVEVSGGLFDVDGGVGTGAGVGFDAAAVGPAGTFVLFCVDVRCGVSNGDWRMSSFVTGEMVAPVFVAGLARGAGDEFADVAELVDAVDVVGVGLVAVEVLEVVLSGGVAVADPDARLLELNSWVCERCAFALSSIWRLSGLADA